jgi:hypothetical protein
MAELTLLGTPSTRPRPTAELHKDTHKEELPERHLGEPCGRKAQCELCEGLEEMKEQTDTTLSSAGLSIHCREHPRGQRMVQKLKKMGQPTG